MNAFHRIVLIPLALVTCLLLVATPGSVHADAPEAANAPDDRPAVLITGASSGIGRRTAEHLAANGFFVYAGARKAKDLRELDAIENVQGIRLDVTKPDEIAAAVETVRAGGRGLYGLINNAGVAVVGPMIEVTEDDLAFQMDVNVFGPYRVTKAFAPMIIESKGRISTTGSISGFLAWGLGGPYTMSKHAIEAYTDVLAAEMSAFGVQVSVIDPGNYNSRISSNMKERLEAKGYSAEGSRYRAQMQQLMSRSPDRSQYKEPDDVAEAFLDAMTSDTPKRRYMVVPNEREAAMTLRSAINRVVQMNADQEFTFDRDELVAMLDEALAASQPE